MDDTALLEQAREHYKAAKDGWRDIYEKAAEDLHFLSDAPNAQWDEDEAESRRRVKRPVVCVDQLSQFIHQVNNDIRMNTPSIHIIPDGDGADIETAEVMQGRIKAIEYKSNADSAYDMGADFAVKSSIGFIRVDHDYIDKDGFEQELLIKRVINPQAVLIDPDSIEPDGSDSMYGFVLDEIPVKKFKKKYPKAVPVSFGEDKPTKALKDQDRITIAEYFCIDESATEYGLLEDGTKEAVVEGKEYKSKRSVSTRKVNRHLLSGQDVLQKTTFPGCYIPIVPVYGEEAWIEGKRNLYSLIRKAKSAQMMYNALKSSETEILMKQLQAPVMAAAGQMRDFEQDWKQPDKAMVLYYHLTDAQGNPCPPPQRIQPPNVSAGYANASLDAENNIRKTLGMYNAGVGKREGDSSGVALKQLERSGDVASFHFSDNLVRSITQVGRILVSALPEIEDTPRLVQTIGKEDEVKTVGINGMVAPDQERTYHFTGGDFGVRVVTGASFTTQRQEAAQFYSEIVTKMPELMPVIGDLVFKYQDNPGSQAISARIKKTIDPKLLDPSEVEKDQPNPQVQALQQQLQQVAQAAGAQIQQLQAELQNKQGDEQIQAAKLQLDQQKLQLEQQKLQIEAFRARSEAIQPHIAPQAPASAPSAQVSPDMSEDQILMMLQEKQMASQQEAERAAMQEQQEAEEKQRQMEMEAQELQLKQLDIESRQQQAAVITQTLTTIAQQLHALSESVNKPSQVITPDGRVFTMNKGQIS